MNIKNVELKGLSEQSERMSFFAPSWRKNCMETRIMTIDLEHDLRSNRCKSMELIVPKLLNFFDDNNIKATFFTVTSLLEKYESEIKEISKKHEIASHSHTHNWLNERNAEFEIKTSRLKLEEYNIKCHGFRAPGFVTTKNHFELLKKYGYKYDSSLATFFPGRYYNPNLPKQPFIKKGLVEFPMSTFIPPTINSGLTYLKLFHPISKLFPQQYMFYLHPWEFLKKKDLHKSKSTLSLLLRRNSGKKAWGIFTNYVEKADCNWIGCNGWMKK